MNTTTPLAVLSLASLLALSGCGAGSEDSAGTAPETAATASVPSTSPSVAPPSGASTTAEISAEHNDADVMFARMMIPHHEQAVEMSEILLADQDVPAEVRELAEGVIAAQGPEIRRMHEMLEAWGEKPVTDALGMDHGSGGHGPDGGSAAHGSDGHGTDGGSAGHGAGDHGSGTGMAGMMSAEDLAALEGARGAEAARLYLEQMTVHHEGAVDMARAEVRDGANPEAVELAEDVIAAQEAEIAEMQELLRGLPASS